MFTCPKCSKKFKSKEALGGHMSSAHAQNKDEAIPPGNDPSLAVVATTGKSVEPLQPPPVTPESAQNKDEAIPPGNDPSLAVVAATGQAVEPLQPPPVPPGSPDDDPGIMDAIREYKRRGFSAKQIKGLGYARSTVDELFLDGVVPEGKPEEGEHSDREPGLPVTTKGTEVVTPEYIMRSLADGSPDWRLRLEGMMLLRAAQRMNRDDIEMTRMQAEADATRIRPILELMKETRLEQDAAAARAKESSIEIAERAAFGVAQDMKGAFSSEMQSLKASLPGVPEPANPMMKAMANVMQPYLAQTMAQLFSSLFKAGRPPQSVQQSPGAESPGQTASPSTSGAPAPGMQPGESYSELQDDMMTLRPVGEEEKNEHELGTDGRNDVADAAPGAK